MYTTVENKSCLAFKQTKNGWKSYSEVETKFKMAATANYVGWRHKPRASQPCVWQIGGHNNFNSLSGCKKKEKKKKRS